MDREELVSVVTREVMKQMKLQSREDVRVSSDRELLVLLKYSDRRIPEFLELMSFLVGTKDRVTLLVSDEVFDFCTGTGLDLSKLSSQVIREGEAWKAFQNIAAYTSIVVPVVKASFLERLLLVDDADRFVDVVYQGLLAKAECLILADTITPPKGRERALPAAVLARVQNLLSRLRSSGLTVTDSKGLEGYLGGGEVVSKKRLITEKDIMALGDDTKELLVDRGTIVTPSARDRAKERGIRIVP